MTEFQELVKDAPKYASMEHGELVAYAYAIYAAGAKIDAENAKLRELVSGLEYCVQGSLCDCCPLYDPLGTNHRRCESLERELGIEVEE